MYSARGRKVIMHKRKSVLVNSPALFSLKLCILFRLFPPFSTFFCLFSASFCPFFPFPVLFYPFSVLFCLSLSFFILFYPFYALFCLIKSSLPSVILLYPFLPSFTLSSLLALSAALFCFLLFLNLLLLIFYSYKAFLRLYLSISLLPFIFALFTLIPVYVFPL